MAGEVPAYLAVGTAVSAKYRGAFCEAKVKTVNKKLVKCKVHFKDQTSAIVHDEFVKGNLKIGATVEAKHPEHGDWSEGVISKLNDASVYTVLFDDGDEKTLRRTSLCLQGDRHFHESETLDHLPLTDPENFGTPVVRDRTKRKRSTNTPRVEEEDGESSGSEIFKRLRREELESAIGRVVIVEMNEKRKILSFPALIVDPSCTKVAPNRAEDHIVTRSFRDNKYYTVSESSWRSFTSKDHLYKGDVPALKQAIEKAVLYVETGQLPPTWDYSILKNKERTDGDSEESGGSSDESDDDEYDVQKDAWLASLHKFMEERGTPINKPPVLGYRDLNLYKLYKLVQDLGGCKKVTDKQQWRYIASKMGISIHTSHSYNIKTAYNKYLFAFEDHNRKLGSSFSSASVQGRPRRRSSYDRWTPFPASSAPKEDKKEADKDKKKEALPEEEAEVKPEVQSPPEVKPIPKKKTRRKAEIPEPETVKEEEVKKPATTEQKQTPPRSGAKRGAGAGKSATKEDMVEDKEDDEEFGPDFEIGERVQVQYGRGRTHKVYEAKIVDVLGTDKNVRYSVHYQGWNIRYDEVVSADRILSSIERRKEKRLARQKARREQKQRDGEQQRKEEQERIEQERQEAEKAKKERDKRELEEKCERDKREKERLKKETEELEKRLKKEQAERELQAKKESEEKKEREDQERREKQEREKREEEERKAKEEELQRASEAAEKEAEENDAREDKKPAGKKKTPDDGKVKTPSKRGRPPSVSPKTVGRPASPRVAGRKSPSTSLYPTRSLRSDRNSLTESPFASGLEGVKLRGRRSSTASRSKADDEEDSAEDSEVENEDNEDTLLTLAEADEEPRPLEPVPEEVPAESIEGDADMPIVDGVGHSQEEGHPPQSPPKLKKEGGLDEVEPTEGSKELIGHPEEAEEVKSKKGKRKGKKTAAEKGGKQGGGKKASKRRHSKGTKGEAKETADVLKEEGKAKGDVHEEMDTAEEEEPEKMVEEMEKEEKEASMLKDTEKKGRKRGRKSLEEKATGGKKAKKSLGDGEGSKRSRRRKRKHGEDESKENEEAKEEPAPSTSQEDYVPVEENLETKTVAEPTAEEEGRKSDEEQKEGTEPSTSDRMMTANITTPPTTPESSVNGVSSPNEDEGQEEEEGIQKAHEESIQAKLGNKSDSDSMGYIGSSGSTTSSVGKQERLEEVSSNTSAEKLSGEPTQAKRGRPLGSTKKKRRHSVTEGGKAKLDKKSHKKKRDGRRKTTSFSPCSKPSPTSSDTDDSSNAENKGDKANIREDEEPSTDSRQPTRTPRPCKYNFTVDVSHMSSPDDRIATIQKQLIDLRDIYLQLKAEVSTIDRRRKRFKRKEREAQAAALMAATSLANFSNSAPAVCAAPAVSS